MINDGSIDDVEYILVLNPLSRDQTTQITGRHFTFKAGQVKQFSPHIGRSILGLKREQGFVEMPLSVDGVSWPEYKDTKAGKEVVQAKTVEGIDNYCQFLRSVIYNEQVSLQRDLAQKNYKEDSRLYMKKAVVGQMEELIKYQGAGDDLAQQQVDKIKELEKKLKAV